MIVKPGSSPVVATTPVKAKKSQRGERQKLAAQSLPRSASAGAARQIAILQRWAHTAGLNYTLSRQQLAEQSYRYLYSALEQLRRPLQQNYQTHLSAAEAQQLQQQLAQLLAWQDGNDTALDAEWLPLLQPQSRCQRVLTSRIDLLSQRAQPELIRILLGRSGDAVSIQLAADATPEANLAQLQQAFSRLQIAVELNAAAQLQFSVASAERRKLEENWQLSGDGIRVAAGNPISVSLQRPLGRLARLVQSVAAEQNPAALVSYFSEAQQYLRQQLKALQQLQAELSLTVNQYAPPCPPEQAAELQAISELLLAAMQPESPLAVSALLAQSQVSAPLVSFALKIEKSAKFI